MPLKPPLFFTTNLNPVEILRGNCGVKNVSHFCTHATYFACGNIPHQKVIILNKKIHKNYICKLCGMCV
jgi:hypothetical protein